METLDLITDALRSIGVIDDFTSPSAEQGATALRNLNKIMASLAEDGIDLGYAPTTTITDDIALPLGYVGTIEALLALREASDRGIEPPAMVAGVAASGYNRMLSRAIVAQVQSAQSDTMPRGETNRGYEDFLAG
jgi:P22 tail accessory factor